jgi:hypothetical protein
MNDFKSQMLNALNKLNFKNYYTNELLPEIKAYNRADTVNMNENEMNNFRHIAGSAVTAKNYGLPIGFGLSIGKEIHDIGNENDFINDFLNNLRGFKVNYQNPNMTNQQYFNHIFNKYIEPNRN